MFQLKYTKELFLVIVCISLVLLALTFFGVMFESISYSGFDKSNYSFQDIKFFELSGSFHHTILEWSSFCVAFFTAILAFVHFAVKRDVITQLLE